MCRSQHALVQVEKIWDPTIDRKQEKILKMFFSNPFRRTAKRWRPIYGSCVDKGNIPVFVETINRLSPLIYLFPFSAILAHASRSVTVRLKTSPLAVGSTQK
jgi:hypothetical protein